MPNNFWPSGRAKGWSRGTSQVLRGLPSSTAQTIHAKPQVGLRIVNVEPGPKLLDGERGAVIAPHLSIKGSGTHVEIGGGAYYDPDLIRATLLLFDRLDSPRDGLIGFEGAECPQGLENWSGFARTFVALEGTLSVDYQSLALRGAFESLDKREPGRWSVSRSAQQAGLPPSAFGGLSGFKIKLENLLPVPDREVPYDDVLRFREDHKPELLALRHHIEELALEVSRGGYSGLAETVALERFMKSLDDYHAAMRPKNFLKRLTSLEISFSLNEAVKAGLGALAVAAHSPSATLTDFLAAAGGVVAIDKALSLKRECPVPCAYEYLFKAGREL